MEFVKTDCFDKETSDFKVVVHGKLKSIFFVGVYTFDIDCFYWHKLFVYENGKKRRPTLVELDKIEKEILSYYDEDGDLDV